VPPRLPRALHRLLARQARLLPALPARHLISGARLCAPVRRSPSWPYTWAELAAGLVGFSGVGFVGRHL
jgi:hypothetical protein